MKLKYCTRCLYPHSKPRLDFDEHGVCSACLAFEARKNIDWTARETAFRELAAQAKARGGVYDCVVPVSGGKDSTYQVIKALEYGLRPLAVTAMTDHLTEVGRRNLNNISKLGVDHVMVQTDQKLRRKLNRHTLLTVGDISWCEHVTIFTVPIREALIRDIPLILYGENPENDVGGPFEAQGTHEMTRSWLEEFGGLNGLRVSDIIEEGLATEQEMFQYVYPDADALLGSLGNELRIQALFLGYYFPWDGADNVDIAEEHGFDPWGVPTGSWLKGENIDNCQTGIHNRFMWLKFGFGRVTTQIGHAIRRGTISREEALAHVKRFDGEYPSIYVDSFLQHVLEEIGMTVEEYDACEQRFMNRELFHVRDEVIEPKFQPE